MATAIALFGFQSGVALSTVVGLRYLVVYSVESAAPQTAVILRVLHGTMFWSPVKE